MTRKMRCIIMISIYAILLYYSTSNACSFAYLNVFDLQQVCIINESL